MRTKFRKVIFAILVLLPVCAMATSIDFYNDGTITDGNVFDTVNIWDSATVDMMGGSADIVNSYNSSTFNFQNGDVTGWIHAEDTSNVTISGGSTNDLELFESAVANISGGSISGHLGIWDDGMVHLYGGNFGYTVADGSTGWLITGSWADDSPFMIFYRTNTSGPVPGSSGSHIVLHTIPEPATLLLLGLGVPIISGLRKPR